jgi:putative ABC transport system substrate-binding protein
MVASSHDPVADGLAASLARPGGNVTGLTFAVSPDLVGKHFQLLREMMPGLARVVWLWDAQPEEYAARWAAVVDASARRFGLRARAVFASTPADLDAVFGTASPDGAEAVFVSMAGVAYVRRAEVAAAARRARRPTVAYFRELPEAGGLMSYGPDLRDVYRRAASYVDRILKGASPADLPIENPTRFELVINATTAKILGLTVPPSVLARADEVIE